MNNQTAIDIMIFFQIVSVSILFLEKEKIKEDWQTIYITKKIGRSFMLFLPTLVILSLLYRPL